MNPEWCVIHITPLRYIYICIYIYIYIHNKNSQPSRVPLSWNTRYIPLHLGVIPWAAFRPYHSALTSWRLCTEFAQLKFSWLFHISMFRNFTWLYANLAGTHVHEESLFHGSHCLRNPGIRDAFCIATNKNLIKYAPPLQLWWPLIERIYL